jgi:hypothetical protein
MDKERTPQENVLRLHPDDIEAIASAVIRKIGHTEDLRSDAEFLASLPIPDLQNLSWRR